MRWQTRWLRRLTHRPPRLAIGCCVRFEGWHPRNGMGPPASYPTRRSLATLRRHPGKSQLRTSPWRSWASRRSWGQCANATSSAVEAWCRHVDWAAQRLHRDPAGSPGPCHRHTRCSTLTRPAPGAQAMWPDPLPWQRSSTRSAGTTGCWLSCAQPECGASPLARIPRRLRRMGVATQLRQVRSSFARRSRSIVMWCPCRRTHAGCLPLRRRCLLPAGSTVPWQWRRSSLVV